MKKVLAILLLVIVCLSFAACSNRTPVETSEELVYAIVTDEYHRNSWTQMISHKAGSVMTMTPISHPAQYKITVKHKEFEKTFNDRVFYEENHDRIGETVAIKLVCIKYNDGSEKTYLALLSDAAAG